MMHSGSSQDIEVVYVDGHTLEGSDYRKRIGVSSKFNCKICGQTREYPAEYGATYEEGVEISHICISCLPSTPDVEFD